MLRKLVATAVLLFVGYVAGAFFGYRSAVIDYVENDANKIESMADDMYASRTAEGTQPEQIPDNVGALIAEAERRESSEEDDDEGARAFQ